MRIKIKKLHPAAQIPQSVHSTDYGMDVVATSKEEIMPGVFKYGIGLAFQMERGAETIEKPIMCDFGGFYTDLKRSPIKLAISLRPRSSVYKTGLVLSSCIGTIDEDYRGEVSAIFYHVNRDLPPYEVGDRIGQLCLSCTFPMEFVEVEELSDTDRGTNGYGSTGK